MLAFLDSLRRLGAGISVDTLARSVEGRPVVWVLAARPRVEAPAAARRTGKPVVYLQADIHGGEVEGKEAAQMLLRDLTLGPLRPLLDSLILLVVPVYNPDGNERMGPGPEHRPGQNGPAVVGQRANGGGLDLNRDYVKMEAPETRGAAELLRRWDPDVFVDLHTTNGSYHGYVLTYAPGLNPNDTPATAYTRDHLLPSLQRRMRERHNQATFSYGNFRNQEPDSLALGWETYDARPRFGTNWVGMRGRIAVLSEAYSNDDFATRVSATYTFVRELLSLLAEERAQVRAAVDRSDRVRADSVAVRSALGPPTPMAVIAELTEDAGEGAGTYARRRRTGVFRTMRIPVYDRFVAARREARPAAYLLPPRLAPVAVLLRRHGVAVHRLGGPWQGAAERFAITAIARGEPFEGHRPIRIDGAWRPGEARAEPGWFLVNTDQPLGLLAAYLLEPASEDGVATWNLLDGEMRSGGVSPVLRTHAAVHAPATALP